MSSPPPGRSSIAEQGPGGDRQIALLHIPPRARRAVEALWAIDQAMDDVVSRSSEPTLAAIKLAWWRERLEGLDRMRATAEPRLKAAESLLLPIGIAGCELAAIEDGWASLIEERIDPARIAARGSLLFQLGGRILGGGDAMLGRAGALWALMSAARSGIAGLTEPAGEAAAALAGHRFARELRPITCLARLAARDLERGGASEPEGSAARAIEALRHRWSGVVVRG